MMKLNPVRIDEVNDTGDTVEVLSDCCRARKPKPTPSSRLNVGPAKQPVVAMSGIPLRADCQLHERRD